MSSRLRMKYSLGNSRVKVSIGPEWCDRGACVELDFDFFEVSVIRTEIIDGSSKFLEFLTVVYLLSRFIGFGVVRWVRIWSWWMSGWSGAWKFEWEGSGDWFRGVVNSSWSWDVPEGPSYGSSGASKFSVLCELLVCLPFPFWPLPIAIGVWCDLSSRMLSGQTCEDFWVCPPVLWCSTVMLVYSLNIPRWVSYTWIEDLPVVFNDNEKSSSASNEKSSKYERQDHVNESRRWSD